MCRATGNVGIDNNIIAGCTGTGYIGIDNNVSIGCIGTGCIALNGIVIMHNICDNDIEHMVYIR